MQDAIECFASPRESCASFAQLLVHGAGDGLAPELDLGRSVLEDHAQARQEHAPEVFAKPAGCHAPRLRDAEVAAVAGFDALELGSKTRQRRRTRDVERKAVVGIQVLDAGFEHLAHLFNLGRHLPDDGAQPGAQGDEGRTRTKVEWSRAERRVHGRHFDAQGVACHRGQGHAEHAQLHGTDRPEARGAAFELCGLGVKALLHHAQLGAALAAQAAQFEQLLDRVATALAELARDCVLQHQQHFGAGSGEQLALARHQFSGQRVFELGQAASLQAQCIAAHARCQRVTRRQREDSRSRHRQRLRRGLALRFDLRQHFGVRGQRVGQRVDLVEHDEALDARAREMLAPDREV